MILKTIRNWQFEKRSKIPCKEVSINSLTLKSYIGVGGWPKFNRLLFSMENACITEGNSGAENVMR